MTAATGSDEVVDTIVSLAEQIARAEPDVAEKAMQIASLAGQLRTAEPDRETIRDAIETEALDSDMSSARLGATTEAVVRAVREPDGRA